MAQRMSPLDPGNPPPREGRLGRWQEMSRTAASRGGAPCPACALRASPAPARPALPAPARPRSQLLPGPNPLRLPPQTLAAHTSQGAAGEASNAACLGGLHAPLRCRLPGPGADTRTHTHSGTTRARIPAALAGPCSAAPAVNYLIGSEGLGPNNKGKAASRVDRRFHLITKEHANQQRAGSAVACEG